MAALKILYTSLPDLETAQGIADTLVREKLAACVNLYPSLSSTYMWKDKLTVDQEVMLIAKTPKKKLAKLQKKLEELHPYDCPCFIELDVKKVNSAYMKWVKSVK